MQLKPINRIAIAAVTCGLVLAGVARQASTAAPAEASTNCTVDASLDSEERGFLTLINNHRAQNGLPPLRASYMLTKASAWKSADMATNAYFAHDDLSRGWVQRIRDCDYGFNTWLGENIAAGISSAQSAFDLWKNSPGHNANMLGANYDSIGIGRHYVAGSPYGWYWSTDFGGFDDGWSSVASDRFAPLSSTSAQAPAAARSSAAPLLPAAIETPVIDVAPRPRTPKDGRTPRSWWYRYTPSRSNATGSASRPQPWRSPP